MQSGHRLLQPLVILGQPPKPGQPGERALDHPAPRQQHEPALGLGVLDDHQPNAPTVGLACGIIPSVALINVRHLHRIAGRVLDGFGQRFDLFPVTRIRWRHHERQVLTQRIHRQMQLRALRPLVTIVPATVAVLRRAP